MWWMLVLGQLFVSTHTTELTYAARQFKQDALVILVFPREVGVHNEWVCVEMHESAGDADDPYPTHCWKPRDILSDDDLWKDFTLKGHYIVATLRQRLSDGTTRMIYAYPLPDEQ